LEGISLFLVMPELTLNFTFSDLFEITSVFSLLKNVSAKLASFP
jgi:hypothetical protein